MKKIPLTQGKFALVDDDDFEHLSQWRWNLVRGYAARQGRREVVNGKIKREAVYMHSYIVKAPKGKLTDHINGIVLDNRRQNLRIATRSQNGMNMKKVRGRSKYKGVYWDHFSKKWRSGIKVNRKTIHIGRYDDEKKAAESYNFAAIKHFGEFASLNIIQ